MLRSFVIALSIKYICYWGSYIRYYLASRKQKTVSHNISHIHIITMPNIITPLPKGAHGFPPGQLQEGLLQLEEGGSGR